MNTEYKTINDAPHMGLNNKICKDPQFYCKSKRIYLSKEDAEQKGCFKKLSPDMMEYKRCNWLISSEDNEKEKIKFKESIKNPVKSDGNNTSK